MKLLRYGPPGREQPGLLDLEGRIHDLTGHVSDIDGEALAPDSPAWLRALDPATLPLAEGDPRLGCPVARIGKLIAVGLNYADHAAESNLPLPKEPIIFTKAISCLTTSPNANINWSAAETGTRAKALTRSA